MTPQIFAEQSQQLDAFAREAGRDLQELHRCVYTTLNINDDAAQAERETKAFAEGYYNVPYEVIAPLQSFCYGTPDTCIAWLQNHNYKLRPDGRFSVSQRRGLLTSDGVHPNAVGSKFMSEQLADGILRAAGR